MILSWFYDPSSEDSYQAGHSLSFSVWSESSLPAWRNLRSLPTHRKGERGGSVVECRTPEREVRDSKPTAAVLCPWARHFTPRKYWLITQEAMAPSRYDWKIVDWDVKPQHNQPTNPSQNFAEFLREISRSVSAKFRGENPWRNKWYLFFSAKKIISRKRCTAAKCEKRAFFLGWSVHVLIMGKVEIGFYFCVTANILTKVLLKCFCIWILSKSLLLIGGHGNQKAKFFEKKKNSKLFFWEAIWGMKLKLCINVYDISLYINCVFYCCCSCFHFKV